MKPAEISYVVWWQRALDAIESNGRLTVRDTLGILETIARGEIPAKYIPELQSSRFHQSLPQATHER